MTLLVAGISGDIAWMVADTAITGGPGGLRERENQIKIVPSTDARALIGFSGDQHHGSRVMEQARLRPAGASTVQFLLASHREFPSADFAYAYRDERGPHLVRISDGAAEELPTLHIGNVDAFSQFQAIRHRLEIDPVPASISLLLCGSRATEEPPRTLRSSVDAMLRLFAERRERDVGGIAVPYLLSEEGTFLLGYGYSVSDPVLPQLQVGAALPHGTAPAGGFGISVTEWRKDQGLVAYWLQKPGGTVFVRTEAGYMAREFAGTPSEFKRAVQSELGACVDLWFGDTNPEGLPDRVTIVRDEEGKLAFAAAWHGNNLSFSVLNVATEFSAHAAFALQEGLPMKGHPKAEPARVTLIDDGQKVRVELLTQGESVRELELDATGLDALMVVLGTARGGMKPPVAPEPNQQPGASETVIIDPAWRSDWPPHPSLTGLMLRLRHPQFGWLSFLLPHNEARAVGQWLVKNARQP